MIQGALTIVLFRIERKVFELALIMWQDEKTRGEEDEEKVHLPVKI